MGLIWSLSGLTLEGEGTSVGGGSPWPSYATLGEPFTSPRVIACNLPNPKVHKGLPKSELNFALNLTSSLTFFFLSSVVTLDTSTCIFIQVQILVKFYKASIFYFHVVHAFTPLSTTPCTFFRHDLSLPFKSCILILRFQIVCFTLLQELELFLYCF